VLYPLGAARVGDRCQHAQQARNVHVLSALIPGSAGIRI
jgi:hypothetical protein